MREQRREPDGIEHHHHIKEGISGSYDHSQEYDPYQSAAKQMQELLFGTSYMSTSSDLRPSTNSAFQKYIPADVPSTADINNRLGSFSGKSKVDAYMNTRRGSGWDRTTTAGGAKVARFCHECGNPFPLPSIRFCCECGVKRLYC